MRTGYCHGCGSYDLCDNGGAAIGWTSCYSDPSATPTENCRVYGSDACRDTASVDCSCGEKTGEDLVTIGG